MVQSRFDNEHENKYEWTKEEKTPKHLIKYGLMREKDTCRLVARIGDTEFNGMIKKESDEEDFMSIIRSYEKQKCANCRWLMFKADSEK